MDDHIAAEALGENLLPARLEKAHASDGPDERDTNALAVLRVKAQTIFGSARPGITRAGSVAMRIVPAVVESLTTVVHDEAAFARVQQGASVVLGRYMHPVVARQVVAFAAAAAKRAARQEPPDQRHPEPWDCTLSADEDPNDGKG